MKESEFLRKVRAIAKRTMLVYRWDFERGAGRHGTVYLGERFTIVKDLKKARSTRRHVQATWHMVRGPLLFDASYPATFLPEADGQGLHVRFPDFPEALTSGDDLQDTFVQAADCLAEAIAGRIARADLIPTPSKPKRGQHLISVPLDLAPKLALYLTMRERGMANTELAKRLGVSETVVRRMLNPKHDTKPEKMQAALTALSKRIVVTIEDAA